MFEHKETLGYLTAQLARLGANRLREGLTPLGLLPAQFTALAEIATAEGMTQKELVQRLGLEQPGSRRGHPTQGRREWPGHQTDRPMPEWRGRRAQWLGLEQPGSRRGHPTLGRREWPEHQTDRPRPEWPGRPILLPGPV